MRPVSFIGLLRILLMIHEIGPNVRARDMDARVRDLKLITTKDGRDLSRTTLYHYRNTLVQLSILDRREGILTPNYDNPSVLTLLESDIEQRVAHELNQVERDAFSELVLSNPDCQKLFFHLFLPEMENAKPQAQLFRLRGNPVVWNRRRNSASSYVELSSLLTSDAVHLSSESRVKSILYGLRYWARDELALIDEFYGEGVGSYLFPCNYHVASDRVIASLLDLAHWDGEWAMYSIRQLLIDLCVSQRISVESLFAAIRLLEIGFSQYVIPISTSRGFATIGNSSPTRELYELKRYYRDKAGRLISHLRVHRSILETLHV